MTRLTRAARLALMVLAAAFVLSACGGDDDGSEPAADTGSGSGSDGGSGSGGDSGGGSGSENQAPTITGSPASEVMAGTSYSFQPSANDPDGDQLSFSVQNLPAWASFDTSTGRITGTPDGSDVAQYTDINITVSDGTDSASLGTFSINVVATASGSASLTWTPPTQNEDGSTIDGTVSFKVYWGPEEGNYPNSEPVPAGVTEHLVEDLTPGTWYFVATAVNDDGVESSYSNVASKEVM